MKLCLQHPANSGVMMEKDKATQGTNNTCQESLWFALRLVNSFKSREKRGDEMREESIYLFLFISSFCLMFLEDDLPIKCHHNFMCIPLVFC